MCAVWGCYWYIFVGSRGEGPGKKGGELGSLVNIWCMTRNWWNNSVKS